MILSTKDYNYEPLTKKFILSRVSEEDIFKRYCNNYKALNVSFKSDLYNDNNPSCRIYPTTRGLKYKDFGTGDHYDCFSYVQAKYNLSFNEALKVIANDFKLSFYNEPIPKKLITNDITLTSADPLYQQPRTKIFIEPQQWTLTDYKYWNQYKIPFNLLSTYNVFSCKWVIVNNILIEYTKNNPIYAYVFVDDGQFYYKVYRPLASKKDKWRWNGKSYILEGYDQLPLFGDMVIITKSMKDVIVLNMLGYNAISLQGEHNRLEKKQFDKLNYRFDKIYSLYDNDEAGVKGAQYLYDIYGIEPKFLLSAKDISDLVKNKGIKYGRNELEGLFRVK